MLHIGSGGAGRWSGPSSACSAPNAPSLQAGASFQVGVCRATGTFDLRFAAGRHAIGRDDKSVRFQLPSQHREPRLQRLLNRFDNQRSSGRVIVGMVLLLALCGWVNGGESGAWRAVTEGTPANDGPAISPEVMQSRFGARRLQPHEMPVLFDMLSAICRKAHLPRLPALYYIADSCSMNAYALGTPDAGAITLTEGLLRGLTHAELAAILAHEVAHIRNNDGWAMSWAAELQRAIALTSVMGLATMMPPWTSASAMSIQPMAILLNAASSIAQLLCMALSRVRELDADALALELTDNPQALVTALRKLERHHTGRHGMAMSAHEDDLVRYLRSHPPTFERVDILLQLAN